MAVLQGALLCDAARDYNGLVSVLGGFVSVLNVRQFPMPAPVWFAGRVGLSLDEVNNPHLIVVRAEFDGTELARAEMRMSPRGDIAANLPHPELSTGVNVVFPLPFPVVQEGMHWVEMEVDGESLVRLPFKVVRVAGAE